jgi:hypothetical protein
MRLFRMIKYILLSNYKLVYTAGAEFEIILNFSISQYSERRMRHIAATGQIIDIPCLKKLAL